MCIDPGPPNRLQFHIRCRRPLNGCRRPISVAATSMRIENAMQARSAIQVAGPTEFGGAGSQRPNEEECCRAGDAYMSGRRRMQLMRRCAVVVFAVRWWDGKMGSAGQAGAFEASKTATRSLLAEPVSTIPGAGSVSLRFATCTRMRRWVPNQAVNAPSA